MNLTSMIKVARTNHSCSMPRKVEYSHRYFFNGDNDALLLILFPGTDH